MSSARSSRETVAEGWLDLNKKRERMGERERASGETWGKQFANFGVAAILTLL